MSWFHIALPLEWNPFPEDPDSVKFPFLPLNPQLLSGVQTAQDSPSLPTHTGRLKILSREEREAGRKQEGVSERG